MQRPAEKLASEIESAWKMRGSYLVNAKGEIFSVVPIATMHKWHRWAKSIDARMRLDGSPRSKKRKVRADV